MKVAVENFAQMKGSNKILMLGAMMELGAGSKAEHRQLVEQIHRHTWKEVVLVGQDFNNL